MVDTYMLMVIGLVMIIMGSLLWLGWFIDRKRKVLFFLGVTLLSMVIISYLIMTDNNIFTYNIPLVIGIRIMIFILGLILILSGLFRCFNPGN